MSHIKILPVFILIFILYSVPFYAETDTKPQKLYSLVDRLSLRDKPGLHSSVIGHIGQGEELDYLNEKSPFMTKYTLKGKNYESRWLKINFRNMTGWVYGGLVGATPLKKTDIFWRAVIAVNVNTGYEGEDWSWFCNSVLQSCRYEGVLSFYYGTYEMTKKNTVTIQQGPHKLAVYNLRSLLGKRYKNFMGYIFLQKGKKPRIVTHDQTDYIIQEASRYFGFKIKKREP